MPLRLALAALCLFSLNPSPAGAQTFSNLTSITIPSSGVASPYPSVIVVSGMASPARVQSVTLFDLSHQWPADVDILLVGPEGQNVVLMSDAGGAAEVTDLTLIFEDGAAALTTSPLTAGTHRPTNLLGTNDTFPPDAPTPTGANALATFDGTDPNGQWLLFVVDDDAASSGSIGGWAITLPEPSAAGAVAAGGAMLALAAGRRRARRR